MMKKNYLFLSVMAMLCLSVTMSTKTQASERVGENAEQTVSIESVVDASSTMASSSQMSATRGAEYYVCISTGSARGEGSKASPLKDIQKAIDKAQNGDVIRIAQGNYLGNLDRGWIEIKGKYVSLEGGWNDDFTERNPTQYITRIQPSKDQRGTIGMGILMIEALSDRNGQIVIDGIFFDQGLLHEYAKADPSDGNFGCPEGCETGRILPVGTPPNKTIRHIGGKIAGNLIIRNCMFLNSSFYGIIMTNMGGKWEIYNNVFVSNLYASCEVSGGLNQATTGAHQSTVDFHHNTVLFSWPMTKEMDSMGYGYRFRNGADHNVHHNIFGCNNFGALDGGWSDSNLPADKRKICSAYDNRFFMNKGDIVLSGTSGGRWLYVPAKRFDEVEMLKEYERNSELENSKFTDVIDPAYLKGFASLKIMTTESYDANSAANLYREANGLNKQGTSTTRVSMFGNRYNFDKAVKLFGAEQGFGAQLIK